MFWLFMIEVVAVVAALVFVFVDPDKSICVNLKPHEWTKWKSVQDANYLQERRCKNCNKEQRIHKSL